MSEEQNSRHTKRIKSALSHNAHFPSDQVLISILETKIQQKLQVKKGKFGNYYVIHFMPTLH